MQGMKFEIGEKYENMKGVFEVTSIEKDSMNIRWEGGEEIVTPIDLQLRIQERMRHEKELAEEQAAEPKKKGKATGAGEKTEFNGLKENDFSSLVSKTTWRSRGQMGGAVTRLLKSKQFVFNSWVASKAPEVHWLDVTRQKDKDVLSQVKFYARVESNRLAFGLYIPAADPNAIGTGDWHTLQKWLERPENDAWLLKQCADQGLCLSDMGMKGFTGTLEPAENEWVHRSADTQNPVNSLAVFFRGLPNADKIDLRIEKRLEKGDAMKKKLEIVDDIAHLFTTLTPLYAAAVPSNR